MIPVKDINLKSNIFIRGRVPKNFMEHDLRETSTSNWQLLKELRKMLSCKIVVRIKEVFIRFIVKCITDSV